MTEKVRKDGRAPDQLRPVSLELDYVEYPEGSVLFSAGRTKVLCNASVEAGVPGWMTANGVPGGWLTAEYSLLPRSTHERVSRETLRPRGRTMEIQRLIGRSLRAALDLIELPPLTITLDCDVLQADGGTRTAAITGGYLALALALARMIDRDELEQQVLLAPVAAVSVGMIGGRPVLDLDYGEDAAADVDANVVLNTKQEYIELQSTAEGQAITRQQLDQMLNLAEKGIAELLTIQRSS